MAQGHEHLQDDADVEAILHLAIRKQGDSQMLRERLQVTAGELGISPEALAAAEREYRQQKVVDAELKEYDRHLRRDFWSHFLTYVIVNAGLSLINLVTGSSHFWALYPIIGWGIAVAIHAAETFNKNDEEYQKGFRKWQKKRRRRQRDIDDDDDDDD
ncbi:MAG TPA: 2TM domain-containing protein [Fimbriimonadaceae bacterium]|nr:2TM domain-containing protein [Fimbriimonadaceae bacterium]